MTDHAGWTRPPRTGGARDVAIRATAGREGQGAGPDGGTAGSADASRPGRFGAWLGRNRARIARGRDMAHVVMPIAPPHARVPLIALSLAAEGLILIDDYRERRLPAGEAGWRGIGVVLDGVGLAAVSSMAPPALARQARNIALARAAFARVERTRGGAPR